MNTIVSVIQDNCIVDQFQFNDADEAESAFVDLVIYHENSQPDNVEINGALEEGVWESDSVTITIGQPESNESERLQSIRNIINGVEA